MSGLALVAHALGAQVTGSDRSDSAYLEPLREEGIVPVIGHAAENIPAGDDVEVVVSTAIAADNPERAAARRARAARAAPQRAARGGQRGEAHAGHRRDARQDDDELDGRPRAAADGGGPVVPHRRRAAHDGPQRGLGRGRVARRRGRRVRPLVPAAVAPALGRHERRARPPRDLRLQGGGRGRVRRVPRPVGTRHRLGRPRRRGVPGPLGDRRGGVLPRRRRRADAPAARSSPGRSSACASPCRARTTSPTPPRRSRRA